MPPSIFEFEDYKVYVRTAVQQLPKRGHGQYRRMAAQMRVHTTLLSHVFRGSKDLTPEQACALATFLGLDEREEDFLLALVELSRAGTQSLKRALERRVAGLRQRHQQLEHRLPGAKTLSREQRATFYSQWYYSAVRLSTSLPGMVDAAAIAAHLKLPTELVREALAFLLESGLILPAAQGFALGPRRTHLGSSSPLAAAHHRNWRAQVMARYDRMTPRDLAFTSPVTLSRADAARVRETLVEAIAKVTKIVEPSACESLRILNIDWLEL